MHKSKNLVLIFLLTYTSLPLHAAVYERDLQELGDGLLTYDNVNQREWLDLPYTFDKLSVIQAQMEPGALLEGFSFATLEDIEQLMLSAEVSQAELIFSFTSSFGVEGPGPENLVDLLGWILHAEGSLIGDFQYTLGQYAIAFEDGLPVFDQKNILVYSFNSGTPTPAPGNLNTLSTVENNFSSGGYDLSAPRQLPNGVIAGGDTGPFWLYRNVIPEPQTISLLLLGAASISFMNRRR